MLHHASKRDGGGAREDGAVAHSEVTLSLVSLPVSPGQAHTAAMSSIPALFQNMQLTSAYLGIL